jgi:hypothetical protein
MLQLALCYVNPTKLKTQKTAQPAQEHPKLTQVPLSALIVYFLSLVSEKSTDLN